MGVLFVPRSSWHPGPPTSNNGSTRPKLRRPVPTMTRHYTGSPPDNKVRTWEPDDWMTWLQSVAVNVGKSFEYNYVIPPRADAEVWEYAGDYQAAHSSGENDVAVGVLFAIGVTNHPSYSNHDPTKPVVWEPITASMIAAYRWLRDVHLKPSGIVDGNVLEMEHRNMPGAATACPGNSVIAADAALDKPYVEEPDMAVSYFKVPGQNPLTVWATSDGLIAVRLNQSTANARGVDVFAVPTLPQTEADKFEYVTGLPAQSVK